MPHISLVPSLGAGANGLHGILTRGGGWCFTLHPTLTSVGKEARASNLLSHPRKVFVENSLDINIIWSFQVVIKKLATPIYCSQRNENFEINKLCERDYNVIEVVKCFVDIELLKINLRNFSVFIILNSSQFFKVCFFLYEL